MFNKNFYPTPKDIATKMWGKIKKEYVSNLLEPSAGKGDLLDVVNKHYEYAYNRRKPKLYAIEIEPELRSVLEGKEYIVLDDDFLQFKTYTPIDTIIMNPPFDDGDKHLLKALETIRNGGQVVCLLNEETLLNPYSNERKRLKSELERLNADIEYIGEAFATAERKTNVRCAIVYVQIIKSPLDDDIFKDVVFDVAEEMKDTEERIGKDVAIFDEILQLVKDYKTEVELMLKALKTTAAWNIFAKQRRDHSEVAVKKLYDSSHEGNCNQYVLDIRRSYWGKAVNSKIFDKYLTYKAREKIHATLDAQSEIEFNVKNILTVKQTLMQYFVTNLEQAAIEEFDEITKHHQNEYSSNIHFYSGWKTNKASRINKKIILPSWTSKQGFVAELEKVLNYFDGFKDYLSGAASGKMRWDDAGQYSGNYLDVTIYKKGTMHIVFNRLDLLDRFNLFVGQKKNWVPDKEERNHKERQAVKKEIFQHFDSTEDVDCEINTSGILLLN